MSLVGGAGSRRDCVQHFLQRHVQWHGGLNVSIVKVHGFDEEEIAKTKRWLKVVEGRDGMGEGGGKMKLLLLSCTSLSVK